MKARLSAAPAAAIVAVLIGISCQRAPDRGPQGQRGSATAENLLLITIDTLRADHVGTYGYPAARTPVMDALARRGIRFDRAFATAPLTLASHASLLTGRYPPGHGARNNGMRMQTVPTLATLLRSQGFATAAFVAAFPLDRRFGLADGFDTYSDRLPRRSDGRPADERPARDVADEAIAWLQQPRSARIFAWVHFFEPHAPYGPPEATDRPPLARYDEEIAVADRQAGRVIDALGSRARSTLVVIAGDHGEAFGEHGEATHGVFVYDTTLRVPLLMGGPGLGTATSATIATPVSLVDVAPTALAALGVPGAESDGIDLHSAIAGTRGASDRVLYAESFAPLLDFGWSSLRSVRSGRWKYIASPMPELYDVEADPGEQTSQADAHRDVAAAMEARAHGFSAAELPRESVPASLEPEAARRLQALGYVNARGGNTVGPRVDPKDRKALIRSLALAFSGEVQGEPLEKALASILREDPGNPQAHLRLGYLLLQRGRVPDANTHLQSAVRAMPKNADAWLGLASCAAALGDVPSAEAALRRAEAAEPGNPVVAANKGVLLSKTGRHAEAIALLSAVVAKDPQFDEARFNLALAYARAGQRERALAETREILRRLPPGASQRSEVERLRAELEKD